MNIKIGQYNLDKQQTNIVMNDNNYLLVVAGAGSGKTLTILGKIYYLVNYIGLNPKDILCISFTKAASTSLQEKILKELKLDISVYTFHKLSISILKDHSRFFEVADNNTLDNIIHEFFLTVVLDFEIYMKKILSYFKLKVSFDIKKKYLFFYKNNYSKIESLEKNISTFLHLFKCNNYSLIDFNKFLKKSKRKIFSYKNEKIFLLLALNIYIIYEKYLRDNNEIDFDDMIINATKVVKEEGINQKYKYIIIDEYQDTSYIRFLLIKSIIDNTDAKIMVVGDDFQSIYRFTGCDLSLFLDFNNYFKGAKTMKIENTYRNSEELITVASNFVMKNKNQIKKQLKSNKKLEKPIKIIFYKDIKETIIKLILKIYEETHKPIMILGRNNNDVNMILSKKLKLNNNSLICTLNENIKIYYLTAHKSKGLEEETVIIINLENNLLGFPNKIKDNKILRFVSNTKEKSPFSEERRLFYVALTRTKNKVYLLCSEKNKSIFVDEIIRDRMNVSIEKIN